jgi:hypothetical protein
MILYLCVLIVFLLHRELLKLILAMDLSRGGSVTVGPRANLRQHTSTHRMCVQDHLFHTHRHKVFIDSQMSRIKYNYYINNVSKD